MTMVNSRWPLLEILRVIGILRFLVVRWLCFYICTDCNRCFLYFIFALLPRSFTAGSLSVEETLDSSASAFAI